MERIQAAIDKARDRRAEGEAPRPSRVATARPAAPPAPPAAADAAWAEIPEFRPSPKVLERNRVLAFAGGPASTPFDMMRTRVLQQMKANNWRRVAVTSPGRANGKTTLTANLAFALARQPDIRVAAIELDLRRPALARTIGLGEPDLQFSRVLEGRDPYAAQLRRVGDNLAFGAGRRAVPRPAELLQGAEAGAALARIESELDLTVMLFDMPPMQVSDDVMAFADRIDCAILVAAAESTTIAEIDRCERDLAGQTNVLGVVLNKCRYALAEYGYGY